MMKNKKFDCVEMKRRIQKQIQAEYAGKSDANAHKLQMEKLLQNPLLSKFSKKPKTTVPHR
jgi:hypothetical protein